MEKKQKNKSNSLVRTCVALACLALLIVSVAIIAQKVQISGFKNLFSSEDTKETAFYYDASRNAVFESVGEYLAVFSNEDLTVYNADGTVQFTEFCHVSAPAVVSGGDYAAAYDIGGEWLCFFGPDGVIKTITDGNPIISASVDSAGYLSVCTGDSGYFGAVEIYDASGTALYRWRSGTAYVLTARTGGGGFTAAALGRGGSRVVRYSLNSEDEVGSFSTTELVIDLIRTPTGSGVLTRDKLIYLDDRGNETGQFKFADKHLERYAWTENYAVLVTGDYQMSNRRNISIVEPDGTVSASIQADGDILDIAAKGEYTTVLYKEKAVLYGRDLGKLWETSDLSGETDISVTANGNVYTAGVYSAKSHNNLVP